MSCGSCVLCMYETICVVKYIHKKYLHVFPVSNKALFLFMFLLLSDLKLICLKNVSRRDSEVAML